MKCVACNKEILDGMTFCPFCNSKQPVEQTVDIPKIMPLKSSAEENKSEQNYKDEVSHSNNPVPVQVNEDIPKEITSDTYIPLNSSYSSSNSDSVERMTDEEWIKMNEEPVSSESVVKSSKKRLKSVSKKRNREMEQKMPVAPNPLNKDGYYNDIPPSKEEFFPVSKGEMIAKFILLSLALISIALYLIYFIQ